MAGRLTGPRSAHPLARPWRGPLLARVLNHSAGLAAGERHVELDVTPEHAQRQACPVAAVVPARRGVEANEARPVLGPVGGVGDVVEALADGDFESTFDFDPDHRAGRLLAREHHAASFVEEPTRRTHESTRSATRSQPAPRDMAWPMPSNSSAWVS